MIVLDVDDELGESLELETAAPEPAGIGEERSSGDARHVFGRWCIHRVEGGGGGGEGGRAGAVSGEGGRPVAGGGGAGGRCAKDVEVFWGVRGGSAAQRGADTGRPDRTAANVTGRQLGTVGVGLRREKGGWPTSRPAYLLGCVPPDPLSRYYWGYGSHQTH